MALGQRRVPTWMGHSTTEVTEMYAHLCAYDPDINLMTSSDPPSGQLRPPGPLRIVQ